MPAAQNHAIDFHAGGNILELCRGKFNQWLRYLIPQLIIYLLGQANSPGFSQRFYPCSNVNSVTHDLAALVDDVAHMNTDADADSPVRNRLLVTLLKRLL